MRKLSFVAALFAIVLFAVACSEDTTGDYGNVPVVDFKLPENVSFKEMPSFTLFVFRSQEELRKCLSDSLSSAPTPIAIDFDKYSLLYAHGSTPNVVSRVERSMLKRGENDYLLEVNVKESMMTAIGKWQILVLAPAIETRAEIEFVKKLYSPDGDGGYFLNSPWGLWD